MKYQMFARESGPSQRSTRHDPTPSLLSLLWTSATSVRVRATDIAAHSFWTTHSLRDADKAKTSGVASRTSDDDAKPPPPGAMVLGAAAATLCRCEELRIPARLVAVPVPSGARKSGRGTGFLWRSGPEGSIARDTNHRVLFGVSIQSSCGVRVRLGTKD